MNEFVSKLVKNIHEMDRFAAEAIRFGLHLSAGLFMMAALFYVMDGRVGNDMNAFLCAKGALHAAPAVLTTVVIVALISDIAIKDRQSKNG